jgi:nucleoside-diphosphate-sugar epimerase
MRIVVTGASSFVGSFLCEVLARQHSVVGIFRRTNEHVRELQERHGVRCLQLDLTQQETICRLPHGPDAMIHCAASFPASDLSATEVGRSNVGGTANLVDWARDQAELKSFINISSTSVYGSITTSVLTEATPTAANDIYGSTKLAAEHLIDATLRDVSRVHLRMPVILGKGAERGFVPRVVRQLRANLPVTVKNPHTLHNALSTRVALAAFLSHCLDEVITTQGIVNLAAREPMTMFDIVTYLRSLTQSTSQIVIDDSVTPSFIVDVSRAESLGYRAPSVAIALESFVRGSG